jgi:hypothetical protein
MGGWAARGTVRELLLSIAASLTVALLVLAGGAAIEDTTPGSAFMIESAPESPRTGADISETQTSWAREYLCCALIYADPGLSR